MDKYLFRFNLTFFGEEKTEEATSKRKEDARKEGQLVKSTEVNAVVIMIVCLSALGLLSKYYIEGFGGLIAKYISFFVVADEIVEISGINKFFREVILDIGKLALPMLGAAFVASYAVNFAQVGALTTTKPLQPKLSNLSPIKGMKRLFSKQALVELFKSIIKIVLVGYIAVSTVYLQIPDILNTSFLSMADFLQETFVLMSESIKKIFLGLIAVSVADYFFKFWQHKQSIKMTKQEVKEEYKQMEGDPKVKGKRKQIQQEMAMQRMMQAVPKADVIITNPTHFAVAMKYEQDKADAPFLVAKGQDFVAEKIKEIAKENKVPIVENKELARHIYGTMDIGDLIPEELYEAVAEVLAYIYSLK